MEDGTAADLSESLSAHVLGCAPFTAKLSHPPADHIHMMWHTFAKNVDPLHKMVHIPTLQLALDKASANIEQVPVGFEALMFAIYTLAVLSLTEDKCSEVFQESRSALLDSYMAATKVALSRAGFMSTTSIIVLQALALHIIAIRDVCDPRAMWALTGTALRIADGMGLRIDGALLGLSPFEAEIRRRIWWQLKVHDFRAAELAGQAKFRDFKINETTPKKPANINDSDLYPTISHAPAESTKPTGMMWCALRADMATFAHEQMSRLHNKGRSEPTSEEYAASDDLQSKDQFIKQMEDMIETKYLRFCDPTQPLHFMTLLGARHALNLIRFMAHHPRRWDKLEHVPGSEHEFVWNTAIQLLEQINMLQSSPQLQCYSWNTPYYIQWHAVLHILDTLRAEPLRSDAEDAWGLIDVLYQNNSETLLNLKKPIVAAVGSLCLRAFDARAATLATQNRRVHNVPDYILQLQDLREAAKVRRVSASRTQAGVAGGTKQTGTDGDIAWTATTVTGSLPKAALPQQSFAKQHQGPSAGSLFTEDDAFWLNALDDSVVAGGLADSTNASMDTVWMNDSWLDGFNDEGFDWKLWDL